MNNQKQRIIETYREKDNVKTFDEERSKYLFQRYKHKVETDFLKKALKEIKKNRIKVLDVGCGTGRMLPEVFSTEKDVIYYGLDTSREMIQILKGKAKESKRFIKVFISDATNIPFKDDFFDITFSFHLLWHIEKSDQKKVLKEM